MPHVFVALPHDDPYAAVHLYDRTGKRFRQVLWGDWLSLAEPPDLTDGRANSAEWLWVRWAWTDPDPKNRKLLKIKRRYTASARPLEIIFVDVGIGDGAVLISPERAVGETAPSGREERVIVIDAGKEEHMRKFLDGRFKAYREGFDFHAAVITHPDADHYYGFNNILSSSKIRFGRLYHNGIVEVASGNTFKRIGGMPRPGPDDVRYVTSIVTDDSAMRRVLDPNLKLTNYYARVIGKGIAKGNVGAFQMLGVNLGTHEGNRYWMPGFAPSDGLPYTIEVLGPWVEFPFDDDRPALRVFGDDVGKTKNGHSVLLRLEFGKFSVLFGGDLNRPAEMFLLQKYAGLDQWPSDQAGRDEMVLRAGERLGSDVMKTCHHGSSDVTDEFIRAVDPAAFVISSGDEDANYVHPRPDLLGRLGKHGRGNSPVLLSTELQRSTRDIDNRDLVRRLTSDVEELVNPQSSSRLNDDERAEKLKKLLEQFGELALPSVAVDGAIYVKTDGHTLIAAFKKETQDLNNRWFYYAYRLTEQETLELLPRS